MTLRAAVYELQRLSQAGEPFSVSSLYETTPIGPNQPDFLNAAVCLHPSLPPLRLLDELQAIELRHGRMRAERWGPRTLDLDLLWMEGTRMDHPRLCVPHPELENRLFALLPLLEVAPQAHLRDGVSVRQALERLPREGVQRLRDPDWVRGPLAERPAH